MGIIPSESLAKAPQYILAVRRGKQRGEKTHIQMPGNKIISHYPETALLPRRQNEEQNI